MINILVLSVLLAMGSLGGNEGITSIEMNESVIQGDTMTLDVFYMYSNDKGSYWLEPEAAYENVIWVGNEDLKEWDINIDELHHGNKFIGTFDSTGWELFGLESVNDK